MLAFVDGTVVLMCVFLTGFWGSTQKPIPAILAAVVAWLAWNHLAGQSRNK